MHKGQGKGSGGDITVQSGVSARNGKPFIHLEWGDNKAQFSPAEMRAHAMGLIEAAAAAEMDACLMAWAIQKMEVPKEDAAKLLMLFRQKREEGKIPSVTLNIDGEPMRPDTVKQAGAEMFEMSFAAEMEAFLVELIIKDIGHSGEIADRMIQEFREMRGAKTLWPKENPD